MAEVKIRKKVQILPKKAAGFSFNEKIKITLIWGTETDLDLCAFFKPKQGQPGGVFSNEYRGKKSDLGVLDRFPFIKHSGDQKEPVKGAVSSEEIKIAKLEDMDTVYLCVVNYPAALDGSSVTFNEHSGKLELMSDLDDQDNLEIDIDSTDEGSVYYIGNITKDGDTYMLYNECKVLDLGDAVDEIPGFDLITKQ
jgi:hypothetical protein